MGPMNTKARPKTHAQIRASAKSCVYCLMPLTDANYSLEHMPPIGMFKKSQRLKGLEFGGCKACNEGTKAADAAVAFFARIDQFGDDVLNWKVQEAVKFLASADDGAPGFVNELFEERRDRDVIRQTPGGVLVPLAETHTGPIGQSLLNVFAAKLGMAMYHEYVGEPLPRAGGVHGMWFLNAGLGEQTAEDMLKILPGAGTLKAGRKSASGQFDYRYNSDDKSIVAALTHFQGNIHFFTIAMADPATYGFPKTMPFSAFVRPGELLKHMPKSRPAIIMPLPMSERFPSLILPTRR
jgi:hypothetical protein